PAPRHAHLGRRPDDLPAAPDQPRSPDRRIVAPRHRRPAGDPLQARGGVPGAGDVMALQSEKHGAMTSDIRDCLPPDRHPRRPRVALPKGSIATHVHVFEPGYPLSPGRGYDPPDSTLADLEHLHATLGVDRVVFTQPSIYGTDNSAILDAMAALNARTPNRARSVVAITMGIADDELAALDASGVRGVRLNTDNKGGMPIELEEVPDLVARIAPFGWHIEFLFPGRDI